MPNDDTFIDGLGTDAIAEEFLRTVRKELSTDRERIDELCGIQLCLANFSAAIFKTLTSAQKAEVIRTLRTVIDTKLST